MLTITTSTEMRSTCRSLPEHWVGSGLVWSGYRTDRTVPYLTWPRQDLDRTWIGPGHEELDWIMLDWIGLYWIGLTTWAASITAQEPAVESAGLAPGGLLLQYSSSPYLTYLRYLPTLPPTVRDLATEPIPVVHNSDDDKQTEAEEADEPAQGFERTREGPYARALKLFVASVHAIPWPPTRLGTILRATAGDKIGRGWGCGLELTLQYTLIRLSHRHRYPQEASRSQAGNTTWSYVTSDGNGTTRGWLLEKEFPVKPCEPPSRGLRVAYHGHSDDGMHREFLLLRNVTGITYLLNPSRSESDSKGIMRRVIESYRSPILEDHITVVAREGSGNPSDCHLNGPK
ncbi:hypothetical protein CIB48_g10302 [Xylaria polymorpha]|nr:hypothetical protein CIB48_g10302 [Xylaria polymorpha]